MRLTPPWAAVVVSAWQTRGEQLSFGLVKTFPKNLYFPDFAIDSENARA